MSVASPLIQDWIDKKLKWRYIFNPVLRSFVMQPNAMVKISDYTYPEGTGLNWQALFDHPSCGIRFKTDPNIDTGVTHTINNFVLAGLVSPNVFEFVVLPPTSPAGIFVISVYKEIMWKDEATFYIFNSGTTPHTCLLFGWTIAVLEEPRPNPSRNIDELILRNQEEYMRSQGLTPVSRDQMLDRKETVQ